MNRSVISLLLVALMMLSLAACKNRNEEANTEPLPPGLMLVPEDFQEEFEPGEEETAAATEATGADKETAATENTEGEKETAATEASSAPTESKTETQPEATETTEPTVPAPTAPEVTQYEWYNALSGDQQMAFMETFDSLADFFEWYNAAKEVYEKENPSIEVGDGSIDLGEIAGGNG